MAGSIATRSPARTARLDDAAELMAGNDSALGDHRVADPSLLEPMRIGAAQADTEDSDQDLSWPGLRYRRLELLQSTYPEHAEGRCVSERSGGAPVSFAGDGQEDPSTAGRTTSISVSMVSRS